MFPLWSSVLRCNPYLFPHYFYVKSDAIQSLKNNNEIKITKNGKDEKSSVFTSQLKRQDISVGCMQSDSFFFSLQSSSLFYHVQFIASCLISSPLPAHEARGSKYCWCNIYTYTCWTYSSHTSDRLIFARVKSSHGSSRLHQKKCCHVLQAVFPALYMADQPWMSCLTGPAAARCV